MRLNYSILSTKNYNKIGAEIEELILNGKSRYIELYGKEPVYLLMNSDNYECFCCYIQKHFRYNSDNSDNQEKDMYVSVNGLQIIVSNRALENYLELLGSPEDEFMQIKKQEKDMYVSVNGDFATKFFENR